MLVAGVCLYARGIRDGAALLFALAASIKLTPLIVIVPLLAWRDWKTLRALALWCTVIAAALVAINGPQTLNLYFLHELPHMASNTDVVGNRTLGSAILVLWSRLGAGASPLGAVWTGRLFSALVLFYAGWLSRLRDEDNPKRAFNVETLAIFLLLSCCVAPASWRHAYILGAPALAIWGKRIWKRQSTLTEAAAVALFILLLSTVRFLQQDLLTPLLGIALSILALHRLARERHLDGPNGVLHQY
jgi:uncharacterized membrane protein